METVGSDAAAARNALWDAVGSQLTLTEYGGAPPVAGERWAIERVLGRGGFGLVCAAQDLKLQRTVAIKLLPRGPEVAELLREARSLARLEHPSIVTVFEIDEGAVACGDRSLPCGWIAMQLVAGETLDAWLRRRPRRASAVVDVVVQAGRALAHAHGKGILHRDLKPTNIMVNESGLARVIDFGLAIASAVPVGDTPSKHWDRDVDALGNRVTADGMVRGTPGYMAPEALAGQSRPESDQYALAVVAWEALTGAHPWQANDETGARRAAAHGRRWARTEPILRRALSTIPGERYPSVDAFCDSLTKATHSRATAGVLVAAAGLAAVLVIGAAALAGGSPAPTPNGNEAEAAGAALDDRCEGLAAWEGQWNLATKVAWTEYSDQLERIRPMRLGLSFDEACSARIAMERFQPAAGRDDDAMLGQTASARPEALPNGDWSLSFDIAFAGDRETYDQREGYHFALTLDRSIDDEPMLHGAFEKRQTESGMVLRNGWALARRDATPTLADVQAQPQPCAARCLVSCAGEQARAACRERQCRPYAEPLADPCGPPTSDFVVPLRSRAERKHLRRGKPFGGVKSGNDGDCEANAKRVAGQWWVWRAAAPEAERVRLDVVPEGCRLGATASRGDEPSVPMSGQITARGAWFLAEDPKTATDPETLVLVGTGPAFGIDMADPGHPLRAFRP